MFKGATYNEWENSVYETLTRNNIVIAFVNDDKQDGQ